MESFTSFDRNLEDDYYKILGCHQTSTVEQILVEYRHRALLLHPDKNNHEDPTHLAKFQKLQEAKEVLCDTEKRKDYDQWRSAGIAVSYKRWLSMKGSSTPVFHWAIPRNEGKMLETCIVESHSSEPQRTTSGQTKFSKPTHDSILLKFRNYQI